jgi:hypothetical protein
MSYTPAISGGSDAVIQGALDVASDGCADIQNVLDDIQEGSDLNKNRSAGVVMLKGGTGTDAADHVYATSKYGVYLDTDLSISTAAGAMVVDDLMQKISTKVQVAAQLLAASNNMNKTASRILTQG